LDQEIFTPQDISQIEQRGLRPEEVLSQLERFKRGFPHAKLNRPCTLGDGIISLGEADIQRLSALYREAALSGRAMKFVPASGAATRMFKALLAVHNRFEQEGEDSGLPPDDPDYQALIKCVNMIEKFAFYPDLKSIISRDGLSLEGLLEEKRYRVILDYLLTDRGLNLARLPKGLIPFHAYPDHTRTPFEEHLVEAAAYVRDRQGMANLHFTVSQEHRDAFQDHLNRTRALHETHGTRFRVSFSIQGHGALLENLSEIGGDIIFIKNIDNVAPDRLKAATSKYKRALGGYLVELQDRIFDYLDRLSRSRVEDREIQEIIRFIREVLKVSLPENLDRVTRQEQIRVLTHRLDRPLRVCGMVRNLSEPGGGPFWVEHPGGSLSRQIVEASQVDLSSKEQRAIWESSTHFNPVDLVCGVRNYRGKPFDLLAFRDPETGFISRKYHEGRELKALELPGLWNGGMAKWNTVFVEVPLVTFSPVKTILDLLRKEHQPE